MTVPNNFCHTWNFSFQSTNLFQDGTVRVSSHFLNFFVLASRRHIRGGFGKAQNPRARSRGAPNQFKSNSLARLDVFLTLFPNI
jgi:hypothetical protein